MTSGTVAIALIVLVWLFVLAPMFLRGHKPMTKAGDAYDEPRVVYEGGSKPLQTRRMPRVSALDVHQSRAEESEIEYAAVHTDTETDYETTPQDDAVVPEVVDGEVIYELPGGEEEIAYYDAEQPAAEDDPQIVSEFDAEDLVGEGLADLEDYEDLADYEDLEDYEGLESAQPAAEYSYDEAYIGPEDMLYPGEEDPAKDKARPARLRLVDVEEELTEEEMDFALHRSRRGGWNPQVEAQARALRLQRRKRTIGGLALLIALSAVAGVLWGSTGWICTAIFTGIMVLYLVTLRKQVISEQQLHARRVEQLRRARLGVANAADAELGIPQRLRHPGAVVLELDDESPDFENLDVVSADFTDDFDNGGNRTIERRVS